MITYELDIQRKDIIIPIRLKHGDAMSRFFKIVLKDGGANYVLPSDAELSLRFCVGGVGGWYSDIELPDGTTRNAVSASGNTFTCEIAEQATHGCGAICLEITGANGYQLSVWNIPINGEEVAGEDGEKASEYYSALIRYVDIAQESAESAQANAEAVAEVAEQVTPLISDVAELKTTTQNTARSLDALWKLNQGQTYDFETDSAESYSKQVVSGAHYASVESVGGKSVVWNQLQNSPIVLQGDSVGLPVGQKYYSSHKYYVKTFFSDIAIFTKINGQATRNYSKTITSSVGELVTLNYDCFGTGVPNDTVNGSSWVYFPNGKTDHEKILFTDLTQMFGAGNEPTSVDDLRIKAIEQYAKTHAEYNAGEIIDFNSESVEVNGRNLFDFPIEDFPTKTMTNGVTFANNGDESFTLKGTSTGFVYAPWFIYAYDELIDGCDYYASLEKTGNGNIILLASGYKETGEWENISVDQSIKIDKSKYTNYRFFVNGTSVVGTTYDLVFKLQLQVGTAPTAITPYKEPLIIPTAELVQKYFPNGMHSAGTAHDEIDFKNKVAVQRVGSVDLGTLIYSRNASPAGIWRVYSDNLMTKAKRAIANKTPANILCAVYVTTSADAGYLGKTGVSIGTDCRLFFHDDTFDTATAFKTAMNGVILRYELETPIITPITEDLTAFEGFSVESGGSIVFENDKAVSMPVPNSVEYIVKLSEVV